MASGSSSPAEPVVINLSRCTLHAPEKDISPPKPGNYETCATVSVDGFPENGDEEILREIFNRCGEILTIVKERKFYITFTNASDAGVAITLSGYRVKIIDKDDGGGDDPRNNGTLLVNYISEKKSPAGSIGEMEVCGEESEVSLSSLPLGLTIARENLKDAVCNVKRWLEKGDFKPNSNYQYSKMEHLMIYVRQWLEEEKEYKVDYNEQLQRIEDLLLENVNRLSQTRSVFSDLKAKQTWDIISAKQKDMLKQLENQIKDDLKISRRLVEEIVGPEYADRLFRAQVGDKPTPKDKTATIEPLPSCSSSSGPSDRPKSQSITGTVLKRHKASSSSEDDPLPQKKRVIEDDEGNGSTSKESAEASSERDVIKVVNLEEGTETTHYVGAVSSISEGEMYALCRIFTFFNISPYGLTTASISNFLRMLEYPLPIEHIERLLRMFPAIFQSRLLFDDKTSRIVEGWKAFSFRKR